MDERGVSDVLAFALTFAIIITGVGLVSLVALDPLAAFSDNQEVVNSERGLQAAGSTVDDIHRSGDRYGQFELVPGDGALFVNETTITVEGEALGETLPAFGDEDNNSITVPVQALEHRFDERSLGLEAGAVFRTDAAGLSYGPSVRCVDDRAVVSLVNLTTAGEIRTSGSFDPGVAIGPTRTPAETPATAANEFAAFELRHAGVSLAQVEGPLDNETTITVDVSETASPTNWHQALADDGWEYDEDEDRDRLHCDTDEATVRIVTIELTQLE